MAKFLAIYIGSSSSVKPRTSPLEAEKLAEGMNAWGEWMSANSDHIIEVGGPLGKTKRISSAGVEDARNSLTGYVIIEAESHDAAAQLFKSHPHFSIFPGEAVEVMECLPTPGLES